MLSTIKALDDLDCDYKLGSKHLHKGSEYILNINWATELKLNPVKLDIPNYDISLDLSNQRLLIIRAMGAGDILFLSPAIQAIKKENPGITIGFSCIKEQLPIAKLVPGIDEFVEYPIEKTQFDSFDHYFQVASIVEGNRDNDGKNVYQLYFEALGLPSDNKDLFRPIVNTDIWKSIVTKQGLISIHPFANDPIRCLEVHAVRKLCIQLQDEGYTPIIIGTQHEYDMTPALHAFRWSSKMYPTYDDVCELIKMCEFTVCSDSLITHLSQAIGTETICFYGPFSSDSRVSSYKNIHVFDSNPECRCNVHQLGKCQRGFLHPVCLRFDIQSVINIIKGERCQIDDVPFISLPEIEYYGMINGE